MNIQKFGNFKLNEEMTYEELGLKTPTYTDDVKGHVDYIIMQEKHVSEKSFEESDKISETVNKFFNDEYNIKKIISGYEHKGARFQFTAEFIFDTYKKVFMK